ncbi:MAG: type IV toxin-antitoxin system AbiEi family antitoxin domain-containing protein [Spirochaetaceae bacterium]|nr:type IV toxin-antitoxin system AbiEi family antitoxin domain-containing protein [Spirochaetaceae bacterium]
MILTHQMVMEQLKEYGAPRARITRMLKSGALIQIKRGLYVNERSVSRRVLASMLYGPSYISFDYALSRAGLIPEQVEVVTSACFRKDRNKLFRTPLGEFRYYYLPDQVYPYGIMREEENGLAYLIATPEKALCDATYKVPRATSLRDIEHLLLDDWRMELDELRTLEYAFIEWIAPMYRRKSVLALAAWLRKARQS